MVVHGTLINAVVYKHLVPLLIRLLLTECMEECHSTDVRSLIELWNQQSICRGVSHAIQLLILCVAYCVCVCVCVLQNLVHLCVW